MRARFTRLEGYLQAEVFGPASLERFLPLIRQLSTETRAHGDTRVLVDLQKVEGELNFTGHFMIGEHVALHLSHLYRIASVVPPALITRTSERVARAQGVQLSVFGSLAEGRAWLLAGDAEDATNPIDVSRLDAPRSAFWEAVRHLFPRQAQAIQLASGHLMISWPMEGEPGALFEMSTPITVRFEPQLLEQLRLASPDQRRRLLAQQETAFRAGLVGYDPYAKVPKARVIVLG